MLISYETAVWNKFIDNYAFNILNTDKTVAVMDYCSPTWYLCDFRNLKILFVGFYNYKKKVKENLRKPPNNNKK